MYLPSKATVYVVTCKVEDSGTANVNNGTQIPSAANTASKISAGRSSTRCRDSAALRDVMATAGSAADGVALCEFMRSSLHRPPLLREQSPRPSLYEENQADEHNDLAQNRSGVGLEDLVDDAERHTADQCAPQITDTSEDHHHERVHDVGLPEVRTDIGELTQRNARHARDSGTQPECQSIHPVRAHPHGLGHGPVLRHRPHLEPEPCALQYELQNKEHREREQLNDEPIVGNGQRIVDLQRACH